ncbi:MAG: hypothetical protein KAS84_05170 [Anaerolineales bacterium]|nr:hypothetical protein [Anaerolineales bacterium]
MSGQLSLLEGKEMRLNLSRRHTILILMSMVLMLSSCLPSSFLRKSPTQTLLPTGTKVLFPPTWTEIPLTSTEVPTQTSASTWTPTPTSTPTPTITPSPNPTGTQDPLASPTPIYNVNYLPDCVYTALEPGVNILPGPFIDPYRVLPTMEPGKSYPAVIDKPTYSLILDDGQPIGWVDYRLLALTMDGKDCLTRRDEREITEYTSLCFFSPYEEIEAFSDPESSEFGHTLSPSHSYVLLLKYQATYFSAFGHAGPSFYVNREDVYAHGNCDSIPSAGKTNLETNLYSQPPDQGGIVIAVLPAEQSVYIQTLSQSGQPPPGLEGTGLWLQIKLRSSAGDLIGWSWSEDLQYK